MTIQQSDSNPESNPEQELEDPAGNEEQTKRGRAWRGNPANDPTSRYSDRMIDRMADGYFQDQFDRGYNSYGQ